MAIELETLTFASPDALREWLRDNQHDSPGIWLVIAKKGAGITTISYAEAVEVGLEHGWIDGQAKSIDAETYCQRFTPRRKQSMWSLRNRIAAEAMIAEGRMGARGLAEVERARADGRWERAYEGSKKAEPHPDFVLALQRNPEAAAFFATLNSQNRYAVYFRLQNAKLEATRLRLVEQFVEKLARGEKFYD
jgi:uncharacterized protein YdeI (YjbR/CyaY-like superfamily)